MKLTPWKMEHCYYKLQVSQSVVCNHTTLVSCSWLLASGPQPLSCPLSHLQLLVQVSHLGLPLVCGVVQLLHDVAWGKRGGESQVAYCSAAGCRAWGFLIG